MDLNNWGFWINWFPAPTMKDQFDQSDIWLSVLESLHICHPHIFLNCAQHRTGVRVTAPTSRPWMWVWGNPRPTCPAPHQLLCPVVPEQSEWTLVASPLTSSSSSFLTNAATVSPPVAPTIQTGGRTDLNQEEGLLLVQDVRNRLRLPASAASSSDVSLR